MDRTEGSSDLEPRLWLIARNFLEGERSYIQEHIKIKLQIYLKVSPERANEGFNLMVKHKVLAPTYNEPPQYYLGDSTPF